MILQNEKSWGKVLRRDTWHFWKPSWDCGDWGKHCPVSEMRTFSISFLSINILVLYWSHLVQKEEYLTQIIYAMNFEYSFSNVIFSWISSIDILIPVPIIAVYSNAWKCVYLVLHNPRSEMTPDLQDSGLVIAAQVRSTEYTTIYDRVGVQKGLQLCNSHKYMFSTFSIVE